MNEASPRMQQISSSSPLEALICVLSRLSSLSAEERAAIRGLPHEVRHVPKGAVLVAGGREEADCYVLLDAFAHKEKFSGKLKRVVAINLPGELVNIESALGMESDYSAAVFRAGAVAVVAADALRELLFNLPSVARAFWLRNQAESAVYREWLLNDERRGLEARLAHLICETSMRLQLLNKELASDHVLPLDAEELVRAVGSIPLYVARSLQRLEAAGAITISADGLTISDEGKLAEIGGFDPRYIGSTHSR